MSSLAAKRMETVKKKEVEEARKKQGNNVHVSDSPEQEQHNRELQTVKQTMLAVHDAAAQSGSEGSGIGQILQSQLVNLISAPVVVMTSRLRVLMWNQGFGAIVGYSTGEGKGCDFLRFITPHTRPDMTSLSRMLNDRGNTNHSVNGRVTFLTKGGGAVDATLTILEMQLGVLGVQGPSATKTNEVGILAMINIVPPSLAQGKYAVLTPTAASHLAWTSRKGNFGVVNAVRRMADNTIVAAKKISLAKGAVAARQAHEHEALVLKSCDHPNIVRYLDSFCELGFLYIVMECAAAGDLRCRVDAQARIEPREYFPEQLISYWAAQLISALVFLHDRNWVHRDIKSANVFLTPEEEVKLGDFGHTKRIIGNHERSVAGTPESMSPEVILGKEYGALTDVWSLGVVLYEVAMLHRPFDGETIRELLGKIVSGNKPPFTRKDCRTYRYLVDQLLTVDVAYRPSMKEVISFPIIQKQLMDREKVS